MASKTFIFIGILLKLPLHLIYWISYYIPRADKKWVFSAWEGKAYRGNSRYFFEYISDSACIAPVWITKNKNLFYEMRNSVNIKYAYSIKGLYDLATARVIIFSHGLYDVIPYITRGALLISVGHATYPIKNMSFTKNISEMNFLRKAKMFILSPYDHIKPAYEIVTSDYTKKSTMFLTVEKGNERGRVIPLGLPKSDYLKRKLATRKTIFLKDTLHNLFPNIYDKDRLILFLPTWRSDERFNIFDFEYNSTKINNMLSENKATMLINFHPFDESLRNSAVDSLGERVRVTSYAGDEVTQLLCAADLFITDYSSLYSDYLLFDRPMIFAKFAHNEYVLERELQVDYDSLPGSVVTDWVEMATAVNQQFASNGTEYKDDRKLWRDLIYSGTDDGKSCERISEFIKSAL